jgi:tetratricopeptide (TPR) repeat protein
MKKKVQTTRNKILVINNYNNKNNMKKISVAFLFFMFGAVAIAQDFKKVQTNFLLKKVEDAKTELEKAMADPKATNSAEANLWKARINAALFADPAMREKYPNSGEVALESFKTYMSQDPDTKLLSTAGMGVVDQLYAGYFNLGRNAFDKQQWDTAYANFQKSYEMGEFITKKNWKQNNQTLDTFTVIFTAYSAQNAKKLDEAAKYYQQFADKEIGGPEYTSVYEFLTKHYLNNKNEALFNKYLTSAKKLYPDNKLWSGLETAYVEENMTLDDKLKKFAEVEAGGKMTTDDYITYGNMFAMVKADKAAGLDSARVVELKKKAVEAFKKAYEIDKTNGIAAFNAGIVLNNEWNDLRERYATYIGASPALKAKRDEIDKVALVVAADATDWLEKAFTIFDAKAEKSRVEKNSYSTSIKLLTNLYEWRRDKARGKVPADYDKYKAKFDFYNAKYGQ